MRLSFATASLKMPGRRPPALSETTAKWKSSEALASGLWFHDRSGLRAHGTGLGRLCRATGKDDRHGKNSNQISYRHGHPPEWVKGTRQAIVSPDAAGASEKRPRTATSGRTCPGRGEARRRKAPRPRAGAGASPSPGLSPSPSVSPPRGTHPPSGTFRDRGRSRI